MPTKRMSPRVSEKYQKEMEANFDNQREAFTLLDLIDAEFRSDPMSVQCFDAMIVERVRACMQKRHDFIASWPLEI